MSNGLIKAFAIIGFAFICWVCIAFKANYIEQDIQERTQKTLADQGIMVERVISDGRDITLQGYISSSESIKYATEFSNDIYGVRTVTNDLKLLVKPNPDIEMKQNVAKVQNTLNQLLKKNTIKFNYGTSNISQSSNDFLNELAKIIQQNQQMIIEVGGHTDSKGREKFNKELSKNRAEAVKEYLVNQGVNPEHLIAKGFGEQFPISSNDTEEGRKENRRVALTVMQEEK